MILRNKNKRCSYDKYYVWAPNYSDIARSFCEHKKYAQRKRLHDLLLKIYLLVRTMIAMDVVS